MSDKRCTLCGREGHRAHACPDRDKYVSDVHSCSLYCDRPECVKARQMQSFFDAFAPTVRADL